MNAFSCGRLSWGLRLAMLLPVVLPGCAPSIGDHCSISTDCSAQGDRLCDTNQPGGYCTVFNCEPNGCPDNSVCVAFNEASCPGSVQSLRFQRTFCMATCGSQGDCRAQYLCLDVSNDPARVVVDLNPSSRRICTVPPAPPAADAGALSSSVVPAVCLPPEAGAGSSAEAGSSTEAGNDAGTDGDGEEGAMVSSSAEAGGI